MIAVDAPVLVELLADGAHAEHEETEHDQHSHVLSLSHEASRIGSAGGAGEQVHDVRGKGFR